MTSTNAQAHVGADDGLGQGALIVTPTYNERSNLEAFVEATLGTAPRAHLLIVDDNSPDGTGTLADEIAARDSRVRVLHRPSKLGLGTAYVAGFRVGLQAEYRYLLEMDADLSHDPQHLPSFFRELEAGADVVIGSRNILGGGVQGWGPGRHLLSKGGSLYSRLILGVDVRDLTSGYKAFTREAVAAIFSEKVESNGYSFQIEMTYRALRRGLKVAEVPIVFVDRQVGKSKMDRHVFAEAVIAVWKLRIEAARGRGFNAK
ncbi:MAG TPA: polyprenol monophosphomannose synthase [Polyangiaceae bacterium]|nr:polyprenol monophosphomannose synthase [Polyangiaceae bacterium]